MERILITIVVLIIYSSIIYIEQKRSGQGFTLLSLLIFYGVFYTLAPLYNESIDNEQYNKVILLLIAVVITSVCYWIISWKAPIDYGGYGVKDSILIRMGVTSIFVLSVIIGAYVIFFKIGVSNFFFVSRGQRSLLQSDYSRLMFFRDLINSCCVVSLCFYIISRHKFWRMMFLFALSLSVTYSLFTISRANLVQVVFPIIYILSTQGKISIKATNLFLFVGFIIATLWKSVLATIFIYGDMDFSRVKLEFPPEFSAWYVISNNVFEPFIFYGKTFLDACLSLIYPFYNAQPLSVWYVNKYEPEMALRGGGRGFSLLVESVLNFGYIGILLVFSLLGFVLGFIERKSKTSFIYFYVCAVTFPVLHKIYRSELLSITKVYWWYYILPIVFVIYVSNILCKSNSR